MCARPSTQHGGHCGKMCVGHSSVVGQWTKQIGWLLSYAPSPGPCRPAPPLTPPPAPAISGQPSCSRPPPAPVGTRFSARPRFSDPGGSHYQWSVQPTPLMRRTSLGFLLLELLLPIHPKPPQYQQNQVRV